MCCVCCVDSSSKVSARGHGRSGNHIYSAVPGTMRPAEGTPVLLTGGLHLLLIQQVSTGDIFFPIETCVLRGLRTAPLKVFLCLRHTCHGVLDVLSPWSDAQPPLSARETPCSLLAAPQPGGLHSRLSGGARALSWVSFPFSRTLTPLSCSAVLFWRNAFCGRFPRSAAWKVPETPPVKAPPLLCRHLAPGLMVGAQHSPLMADHSAPW